MMKRIIFTVLLFVIFLKGIAQEKYTLTISFVNIGYQDGSLYIGIYNSEKSFLNKRYKQLIVSVKNGKAKAIFKNLEPGSYAVSSYYDKNKNGKLDTNFLGMPKEPVGFSNNVKINFGPPKFNDAKFIIKKNKSIRINY